MIKRITVFFVAMATFGHVTADELFDIYKARVSPIIQNNCANCHVSGGSAGGTRLVYKTSDSLNDQQQNFDLLVGFIRSGSGAYLLSKGSGNGHGGGNRLSNQDNYSALSDFVDQVEAQAADSDGDGLASEEDNCPNVSNADQADLDQDASGDVCDADIDGDGLTNDDELAAGTDPRLADSDGDGVLDDQDLFPVDASESSDRDADGIGDNADAFPDDSREAKDADNDGVGDNADQFDDDPSESIDTDGDGQGDNADLDDDGDGWPDADERTDETNPLSNFSCRSGCYGFDIDQNGVVDALTDGLLMLRYLFGFEGNALVTGALANTGASWGAEQIVLYLSSAGLDLDIDGNQKSEALSDGLLFLRYAFGFRGDALVNGALGSNPSRKDSREIEAYIESRLYSEQ
ncbi:MAG: hypothetical protein ACPHAN_08615 [Pseudomonadales bacterium]